MLQLARALEAVLGKARATTEEAIAELEENEKVWLDTAIAYGIPIQAVPERWLLDICYGMIGLPNKWKYGRI